jgi:hypothetical protein
VDTFDALRALLSSRPADENPLVAMRETFCEFAVRTPLGDEPDSHIKAILEANPQLKTELDRVFSTLRDQLASQLVARYPTDPAAATAAAVAVNVSFALLWLAYLDASNTAGSRLSADRLREYFDVFREYPLT